MITKIKGYKNYPRFCPQCKSSFYHNMEFDWKPDTSHDKIWTCKSCKLQIHAICKPENYLQYGKPITVIKLWKWETI